MVNLDEEFLFGQSLLICNKPRLAGLDFSLRGKVTTKCSRLVYREVIECCALLGVDSEVQVVRGTVKNKLSAVQLVDHSLMLCDIEESQEGNGGTWPVRTKIPQW